MATPMVSFDFVFQKLSEKLLFLFLLRGTRFLIFERWFLVKNLKTMNHLKTTTMVAMETKFISQDSMLDKLSEKYYLSRFLEGNRDCTRHFVPPPPPALPAGAPKKPAPDRVKILSLCATEGGGARLQNSCRNGPGSWPKAEVHSGCRQSSNPRWIYSNKSLKTMEQQRLDVLLEQVEYTCDSPFTTEGSDLLGQVVAQLSLLCHNHVEFVYFACPRKKPGNCCHCGGLEAMGDPALLQKFKGCCQCARLAKIAAQKSHATRNQARNNWQLQSQRFSWHPYEWKLRDHKWALSWHRRHTIFALWPDEAPCFTYKKKTECEEVFSFVSL